MVATRTICLLAHLCLEVGGHDGIMARVCVLVAGQFLVLSCQRNALTSPVGGWAVSGRDRKWEWTPSVCSCPPHLLTRTQRHSPHSPALHPGTTHTHTHTHTHTPCSESGDRYTISLPRKYTSGGSLVLVTYCKIQQTFQQQHSPTLISQY